MILASTAENAPAMWRGIFTTQEKVKGLWEDQPGDWGRIHNSMGIERGYII